MGLGIRKARAEIERDDTTFLERDHRHPKLSGSA
jgi:hypothetical protein